MSVYQNTATLSAKFQPVRELKLTRAGAILAAGTPRYDTFDEYIEQMAAPMSSLPSAGWVSFSDPCTPEMILLVQGERVPWCEVCEASLDDCDCAF